jgi:hypothetical protein
LIDCTAQSTSGTNSPVWHPPLKMPDHRRLAP